MDLTPITPAVDEIKDDFPTVAEEADTVVVRQIALIFERERKKADISRWCKEEGGWEKMGREGQKVHEEMEAEIEELDAKYWELDARVEEMKGEAEKLQREAEEVLKAVGISRSVE